VHTAVAVQCASSHHEAWKVVTASVHMKAYDRLVVDRYLATEEPMGKAGAYSIQGAGGELIDRIDGDYLGVVGLPVRAVATLLIGAGLTVPVDVDALYREKPYPNWARFVSN
ncbi:MAG: Maf family protein, partial [Nitrospira sp.]